MGESEKALALAPVPAPAPVPVVEAGATMAVLKEKEDDGFLGGVRSPADLLGVPTSKEYRFRNAPIAAVMGDDDVFLVVFGVLLWILGLAEEKLRPSSDHPACI
jgi:hypothetical protein